MTVYTAHVTWSLELVISVECDKVLKLCIIQEAGHDNHSLVESVSNSPSPVGLRSLNPQCILWFSTETFPGRNCLHKRRNPCKSGSAPGHTQQRTSVSSIWAVGMLWEHPGSSHCNHLFPEVNQTSGLHRFREN